ncbi:MAG: hypothetical protein AAFX81_12250 [Pseudomonadota bacterium]
MTLLRPAFQVTLGGQRVDSSGAPLSNTISALDVQLSMDPMRADQTSITLGQVGALTPAPDDAATIELGYADEGENLVQVMAGTVFEVGHAVTTERIVCLGAAATLARRTTATTFRDRQAGEIVRALATDAGVAVARTGTSSVLPYYAVDRQRSLLRHMADLAALTGFDLYVDAAGELVFEPFGSGREVFAIAYATDVLSYDAKRRPAVFGGVEAFGESPGASAGADSWSWLTKDFGPRKGSAGRGDPVLHVDRSALRTAEAAQQAADAALTFVDRQRLAGQVQVIGRPAIGLGDAIRLSNMPEDDLNATFQVRALRHRLDRQSGFVTDIRFRSLERPA